MTSRKFWWDCQDFCGCWGRRESKMLLMLTGSEPGNGCFTLLKLILSEIIFMIWAFSSVASSGEELFGVLRDKMPLHIANLLVADYDFFFFATQFLMLFTQGICYLSKQWWQKSVKVNKSFAQSLHCLWSLAWKAKPNTLGGSCLLPFFFSLFEFLGRVWHRGDQQAL